MMLVELVVVTAYTSTEYLITVLFPYTTLQFYVHTSYNTFLHNFYVH
jgi:hypothetical protein